MANHDANGGDVTSTLPARIPYWRMVFDQASVTRDVANHPYKGSGTESDPYLIHWIPNDPRDPQHLSTVTKWCITMIVAIATLAVALVSSAYTGGITEMIEEFKIGQEVATLGVSLFVLGFAIGPLLWAPLSELFGRQVLFFGTYAALTAFNAGAAGAQNPWTLLILRFFAGAFGSSPLTNAGGVIADMFSASERGLATSCFAAAPFLGPVLGPIIGGFLGMNAGWRWVLGFLAAVTGFFWILASLLVPETYTPVLLRKRAAKLSKITGKSYVSKMDFERGRPSLAESLKTALSRPWILLFKEPIVLLLSIYMAVIYGTLYMLFAAFPIVYQVNRGWSSGIGGLAFLGIAVGMLFSLVYNVLENRRYIRVMEKNGGRAPPEARLPPTIVGSIALPIGLFWFAWTNYPSIHWMASIAAGVPFGFGMVLVFLSTMNYLIDTYTIFAASVLAANSVIRSLFGAAFPLFTTYMYQNLGIHWASSIPAFLALACAPFPFIFYKYGASIRSRCHYAAESDEFMRKMQEQESDDANIGTTEEDEEDEEDDETEPGHSNGTGEHEKVPGLPDLSRATSNASTAAPARRMHSAASTRGRVRRSSTQYESNPYDIDRVNTQQSDFSLRLNQQKHSRGTNNKEKEKK